MFRASLRPSSGGQTAFSLHMVICPVVTCDVGGSAGKLCALCGVGCLQHRGIKNSCEIAQPFEAGIFF